MINIFKPKFKLFKTLILLFTSLIFILSCNNSHVNNIWTSIDPLPLDPDIEAQIDEILPKLTLEQINKLRKVRAIKRAEDIEHKKFVNVMYKAPTDAGAGGGLI